MTCRIAGLDRTSYPVGTVVTATAEKRSIILSNETTKATCELGSDTSQQGTIHLYVKEAGVWVRALNQQYGNWGYFYTSIARVCDEIEVVENSESAVEIVMRWNTFALGANVPLRDYTGALNYAQGQSNPNWKTFSSLTQLTLSVRIEDKYQGVFLGWHSIPRLGPDGYGFKIDPNAYNGLTDYGERELGTGSESSVIWSSGNHVSRFPAWALDPKWTTAEGILGAIPNHTAWVGIDDPDIYAPFNTAAYIATQDAGFPKSQTSGPYWAADIRTSTNTIRYLAMRKKTEVGVWSFSPFSQAGTLVSHFNNEWPMANGNVYRFQIFLGAFVYSVDSSNSYANEPSAGLKIAVMNRINTIVWPGENHIPGVWS
jgi:hypothetical protein